MKYKLTRTTHGMTKTRIYQLWKQVIYRCQNPKDRRYRFYGAKGVKVCERWHEFTNFFTDMGHRPEGKSLDRINTEGDYSPGNCRWATVEEQHRNRRDNRRINGMIMFDWARLRGMHPGTLQSRLRNGWDEQDAINMPVKRGRHYVDR